jgi:hypothetical protein
MKAIRVILMVVLVVASLCVAKETPDSYGQYEYFTEYRNITNINTQLPVKMGLLRNEGSGVRSTGSYLILARPPKDPVNVSVSVRKEGDKISFSYASSFLDVESFSKRIPLSWQVFHEDVPMTHIYLVLPKGVVFVKEVQYISVMNLKNGERKQMMSCSPGDTGLSEILKMYNTMLEGGRELSKSGKSEMERALDNTLDKAGKVGFGVKAFKGAVKYGLRKAEEKRMRALREKYGEGYQVYKMPFYPFKGASLRYINLGRRNALYLDSSKLTESAKVFIEVPQITFEMSVPGEIRKASLLGLVYEMEIGSGNQGELNEALIKAVVEGNLEEVKQLVRDGADINASIERRRGLLPSAFVFEGGCYSADVASISKYGKAALILASFLGHLDVVEFLLENGADVNAVGRDGNTALMWASPRGHIDVMRLLLKNGADVNAVDKHGINALEYALGILSPSGGPDVVKLLRENGAKIIERKK